MERRKIQPGVITKHSELPVDYLRMVAEVFTANFDSELKKIRDLKSAAARFKATGGIFPDEIVVCVSLLIEGELAATSIYASIDFDPKASAPTVEDLLGLCVDGIGTVFGELLKNDQRLSHVAEQSLSALDNVPFEWTEAMIEKKRIFVKIDKSNPELDQMADEFLKKHDPDFAKRQAEEETETEKLFVTGPKKGTSGTA